MDCAPSVLGRHELTTLVAAANELGTIRVMPNIYRFPELAASVRSTLTGDLTVRPDKIALPADPDDGQDLASEEALAES